MEMLDETLEMNFGVSIDANLEVDFSSFASIIDILGGVDIELTSAEANHMNGENGLGPHQRRQPPGRRAGPHLFQNPEAGFGLWAHQPAAQCAHLPLPVLQKH